MIIQDIVRVRLDQHLPILQKIIKQGLIDEILFRKSQLPQIGKLLGQKQHIILIALIRGQPEKLPDTVLPLAGKLPEGLQHRKIHRLLIGKSGSLGPDIADFLRDHRIGMIVQMVFFHRPLPVGRAFLMDVRQNPGAA